MFHLKIVSNVSRFKPALHLNRVLADLNRGSNSLNSISDILNFKYQRFTPSGCTDRGLRKLEFMAKTQFFKIFIAQEGLKSTSTCSNLNWPYISRTAVVRLNFRAGSTFPVNVGLVGATRLTRSDFRLNLLLLKGQRCVI